MAKSFVLQLAALATLFVSLPAFITLIFGIINIMLPDAADGYWYLESSESSIRYSIAVLVIFFPAYLYLTRVVNQARRGEGELYHTLTRWIIYLALLVAGLIMLGDLATVVYTFLNGELTLRFLLKAATLFLIIGAASYYYMLDARDHWQRHEKESVRIGVVALAVVLASIVFGFMQIDAPSVAREVRLDQTQISDLQDMQWRIESFYQANDSFPARLEVVYEDVPMPSAPEGREAYEYNVTGADTYELCATFAHPTPSSERSIGKPFMGSDGVYLENQNWEHPAGRECFDRKIIPLDN